MNFHNYEASFGTEIGSCQREENISGIVVLAGGQGQRLGGVNKSNLVVEGKTLLKHTLSRLPSVPTVVVAPPQCVEVPRGVAQVMESPPGGGPAAGFSAGLRYLLTQYEANLAVVALTAVDSPLAGLILPDLAKHLVFNPKAQAVLPTVQTVKQRTIGVYRVSSLSASISRYFPVGLHNVSLQQLQETLNVVSLEVCPEFAQDLDTFTDQAILEKLLNHLQ